MLPRGTAAAAALAAEHDGRLDGRALTETDADRPLRHALEVRHPSYADRAFVELLRAHDVALVVADSAGTWPHLEDVTADFVLRPAARRQRALHQRVHPGRARRVGGEGPRVAGGGVAEGGVHRRRARPTAPRRS